MRKLTYVARSKDHPDLACSSCDKKRDVLAAMPVLGELGRPEALMDSPPWIGLCRSCVAAILSGFAAAEIRARVDVGVDG